MNTIVDIAKRLYACAPGAGELVTWDMIHETVQAKWITFTHVSIEILKTSKFKLIGTSTGRFSSKGPNRANKPRTEPLMLDRDELGLGKYTKGYANLTDKQLHGLLWLLGEWSCRADHDGSVKGGHARGQAALKALRSFNRNPFTLDEAQELMRDAAPNRA